jgi:AcrR family transcriptional regulator
VEAYPVQGEKTGVEQAGERGQTRDMLLAAASDIMKERDSLDISLSDIGSRAQVNAALVKYYFGNKHGLLLALLERDLEMALTQLNGLVQTKMAPGKKMQAHLAGIVKLYFKYPYLNRLSIELMRNADDSLARSISDRFSKPIHEAYNKMIAEGVAAGEFRPVDPMLFYFTVIGGCDQIFSARYILKYVYGTEKIDDDLYHIYVKHTASLIMDGLLVRPEHGAQPPS